MKKTTHLIIAGIAGVSLAILLFVLPKTVVKDGQDNKSVGSAESEEHSTEISLSESSALILKQKKDSLELENVSQADILVSIAGLFSAENIFDSAGYYMNLAGEKANSVQLYGQSADLYFQAYSLSIDPVKRDQIAEITRAQYDKVLKQEPRDLHARTNKAMTFVTSDSPMQAIMLLRQVLNDQPKYTPAIMSLGALSMQSGQYDKAVERFKEVLIIDPENIRAKLGLAYSLLETEQKQQGIELLNEIKNGDIDEVLKNEIENTLKNIK